MTSGQTAFSVVISQRRRESQGVISLLLEATDGGDLPEFSAGAHIDVITPGGLVRQYSLCSHPADRKHYRIGVLLTGDSRGGSREIHRLAVGSPLRISAPRNLFHLHSPLDSCVLIAGGIGVTPIMTMARTLHERQVPFVFHYLTRTRALTPFRKEITAAEYGASVVLRHDDESGVPATGDLALALGAPSADRHAYVCGPEPLVTKCLEAAAGNGWPADSVHVERFRAPNETPAGAPLLLKLARSGIEVAVAGNKSMAKALIEAGINVPVSCEQGICGTCVATVLEGVPEHRDSFLSHAEKAAGRRITLCCSRSVTPSLTLDL